MRAPACRPPGGDASAYAGRVTTHVPTTRSGPLFARAVKEVEECRWRPEMSVEQIPSPQRIAPYSMAIAADLMRADVDLGNGRLILLHDPAGSEAWDGAFRCVTFARADVDLAMVTDPLLAEVGWSWLTDALDNNSAPYRAASGTVTAVSSRGFGAMAGDPDRAEVEIRASWTPDLDAEHGLTPHLLAWQDLLCMIAGVPPVPEGVILLNARQGPAKR